MRVRIDDHVWFEESPLLNLQRAGNERRNALSSQFGLARLFKDTSGAARDALEARIARFVRGA
jgi:hypothetical protein